MKQYILYDPFIHEIKFRTIKELVIILNTTEASIYSKLSKGLNYFTNNKMFVFRDYDPKEIKTIYKQFIHEREAWIKHDDNYSCSTDGRIKKHLKTKDIILIPFGKTKSRNPNIRYIKIYGKETKVSRFVKGTFEKRKISKDEPVYHLDENQYNNSPDNLIILSKKELGKRTGANSRSMQVALVDENGRIIIEYASIRKAARDNFISYQTVIDYLKGRTKSACGMKFIKIDQS